MATCPACGANSRTDPSFTVTDALVAKPLGTWSLAGVGMKTVATSTLRLSHSCGWSIDGGVRDGDFYGDPATQVFPAALADTARKEQP